MPVSAPTLEQVLALAQTLSSLDKVRLVEQLSVSIEREMEALSNAEMDRARLREWQATVERTGGGLTDDPIERPSQGNYERRDDLL